MILSTPKRESVRDARSALSAASLERAAGDAAQGRATHPDIVAAIARAERRQALVIRAAPNAARGTVGYATREGVEAERAMLRIEAEGRGRVAPLLDRIDAAKTVARAELAARDRGHAWTEGQRDATRGLLTWTATVTGIQGSAGTAKTTTVLATYADAARAQGLTVRALAPTATAADVLARANVAQLGSVEAGRAFGQLQDHGMATFKLEEIVRQTNAKTREAVEAMLAGDAEAAFAALDQGGGRVVVQPDTETRIAVMARDFAKLTPAERDATLVLDPTREGRQRLTNAIRAKLLQEGQLGGEAITARVLEPRGLGRAEASEARSYQPGDLVAFRKGDRHEGIRRYIPYQVQAVDAPAGIVRLFDAEKGKAVDWQPARWGSDVAEASVEQEQEFRQGDRVQFTRNNKGAGRINGRVASVVAVDAQGSSMMIELASGKRQMLDLAHLADRHIRPGWVRTIHSSQGATAERVMAHMESFRTNTVDTRAAYVAISRARSSAALYTDSRADLLAALGARDGAQIGALDEDLTRYGPAVALDGPGAGVGLFNC